MLSITSPVAKEKISDVVFLVFGFCFFWSNLQSRITYYIYLLCRFSLPSSPESFFVWKCLRIQASYFLYNIPDLVLSDISSWLDVGYAFGEEKTMKVTLCLSLCTISGGT